MLWDRKYNRKIAVWDDIETIYMAARLLGFQDSYNLTDEQLEQLGQAHEAEAQHPELLGRHRAIWRS